MNFLGRICFIDGAIDLAVAIAAQEFQAPDIAVFLKQENAVVGRNDKALDPGARGFPFLDWSALSDERGERV
jgi:hypothetical protein